MISRKAGNRSGKFKIRFFSVICYVSLTFTGVIATGQDQPQETNQTSITDLCSPDHSIRLRAFIDFRRLGEPKQREAATVLIKLLDPSHDADCRAAAAESLERIGLSDEARDALGPLMLLLDEQDQNLQLAGISAIGYMRRNASEALPRLIELLKTSKSDLVISGTEYAIGTIAEDARTHGNDVPSLRNAVDPLINRLNDTWPLTGDSSADNRFIIHLYARQNAARALGFIGPDAARAIESLESGLADASPVYWELRLRAAEALGSIGPPASPAASSLTKALHDAEPKVRAAAADSLGKISPDPGPAIHRLVEALTDSEAAAPAAASLNRIAEVAVEKKQYQTIGDLNWASEMLAKSREVEISRYSVNIANAADHLETLRLHERFLEYHSALVVLLAIMILFLFILILLWFFPLSILKINDSLAQLEFKTPSLLGGFTVPVRQVLLVGFFYYHPKVLDAWVKKYVETVRQRFNSKRIVAKHQLHLPAPVILNSQSLLELSVNTLQSLFQRQVTRILICGEDGLGKTNLACQISNWALEKGANQLNPKHLTIPVLLENRLELPSGGADDLIRSVCQQLQVMTDAEKLPKEGLVRELLSNGRVLLILDSISDLDLPVKSRLLSSIAAIPANAVVITSREDSDLFEDLLVIQPQALSGASLSRFLQAYFTYNHFEISDEEFFQACHDLSSSHATITPLVARNFADQMLAARPVADL